GLAGQDGTNLDRFDTGGHQLGDLNITEITAGFDENLAGFGRGDIDRRTPRIHRGFHVLGRHERAVLQPLADDLRQTTFGAAVIFADDDVLADVHQTAGEVTRVGRSQGGIGQALTRTVRRDEVLDDAETFTEIGLNRPRNDFTLRIGHQAAHRGDLAHLHHIAASTRIDHHEDRIVLVEALLHFGGDFAGGLRPDLNEFLTAFVFGDQTPVELRLHLGGLILVIGQDLGFGFRRDHIADRDRDTRSRSPVKSAVHEIIQGDGDVYLGIPFGQRIDDDAQLLFADLLIDVRIIIGQGVVENRPTQGSLYRRAVAPHRDGRLERDFTAVEGHLCLSL